MADPRVISGTLVRVDGPREMPAANPWRTACVILGTLVLLPIVIGCMFLALAIRIAMQMVGIRSGGGSGLLTAFSPFRMLGTGDGQRAMIPTYQLVVNTPLGTRVARQEGEFQSAQPLVGHEVTLRGGLRDGVLVVTGGIDNTIGTRFVRRPNGWAALFMVLLAAATGGIIALATSR